MHPIQENLRMCLASCISLCGGSFHKMDAFQYSMLLHNSSIYYHIEIFQSCWGSDATRIKSTQSCGCSLLQRPSHPKPSVLTHILCHSPRTFSNSLTCGSLHFPPSVLHSRTQMMRRPNKHPDFSLWSFAWKLGPRPWLYPYNDPGPWKSTKGSYDVLSRLCQSTCWTFRQKWTWKRLASSIAGLSSTFWHLFYCYYIR